MVGTFGSFPAGTELTSTVSTSYLIFSRADLGSGLPMLPQAIVFLSAVVQHLSEHFRRGRFAVGSVMAVTGVSHERQPEARARR
jgi:hypothetical protein